jgi:hypothetical protein
MALPAPLLLPSNQSPKYTKDNAGAAAVASMIRHEEEQLPVNQRGSITGRLGETHVLELFVHLRCVWARALGVYSAAVVASRAS